MARILTAMLLLTWLTNCNPKAERPNIILFLIDDMGWKDVGFMGSDFYETPNIDQLAAEGMIFSQAYANAPNCAPSRACLMSGQYSPRHGIYTVGSSARGDSTDRMVIPTPNTKTLHEEKISLAETLKSAGYATFHGGKWHLGADPESGPLTQGFDRNIGGKEVGSPPGGYFAPWNAPNLEDAPEGSHLCDYITNHALTFLEENQDHPFFLYLAYYDVHSPLQAKPELIRKYEEKKQSNEENSIATLHNHATYAGMVENTDWNIGRVLNRLSQLDLEENTIVIFTSDNGGFGNATTMRPLRGCKGTLYEGGIRVPMTMKWPSKIPSGTHAEIPVIGLDIYPTLLDILSVDPPENYHLDGESLMPLMTAKSGRWKRSDLFWHFPAYLQSVPKNFRNDVQRRGWRTTPASVIRHKNWKLIEYFEGSVELYDLSEDIGERKDLSTEKPEITQEVYNRLKKWQEDIDAPIPRESNPFFRSN